MKTSISTKPAGFAPVSITITFETQKELDAFGSAMNTVCIAHAIGKLSGLEYVILDKLARPLEELGANIHDTERMTQLVRNNL